MKNGFRGFRGCWFRIRRKNLIFYYWKQCQNSKKGRKIRYFDSFGPFFGFNAQSAHLTFLKTDFTAFSLFFSIFWWLKIMFLRRIRNQHLGKPWNPFFIDLFTIKTEKRSKMVKLSDFRPVCTVLTGSQ